jgi:hypothetical protein
MFRCHPSLYPQGELARPWYDFANISFKMGCGVFESYPAKVRLFGETVYPCGKKEVLTAVQQQQKIKENIKKTATFYATGQTVKQISGCQGIYDELHSIVTLPIP